MRKITTLAMVAVILSAITTGAFAFDRPNGPPPGMSEADSAMPPMMRRPNPVIQALVYLELSSDQRRALKLLEVHFKEEMHNLKSTQLPKEEEIVSALEKNGFDIEKFSKILEQKCTKENALRASHLKEVIALLTEDQITALKNQLTNGSMNDLGY